MKNNHFFYILPLIILVILIAVSCAINKESVDIQPSNQYFDKWHYYGEKVKHPCYDSISDKDTDVIIAYGVGFGNTTSLRKTAVSDAYNDAYLYINKLVNDAVRNYNQDSSISKKIDKNFEIHIIPYTKVDCYKMTKQNAYVTLDIDVDSIIPSILNEINDYKIVYEKELFERYLDNALRNRY